MAGYFLNVPLFLFVIACSCAIIDVTGGQNLNTIDCNSEEINCAGTDFPVGHANGTVMSQCTCMSASDCLPPREVLTDYRICGIDVVCCLQAKRIPELEDCECTLIDICEKEKTAGHVIRPRLGSKDVNCKAPQTTCCPIHHDETSSPSVPSPSEPSPSEPSPSEPSPSEPSPSAPSPSTSSTNNHQTCGFRTYSSVITPRIPDGVSQAEYTNPSEFPWVVQILQKKEDGTYKELCAGTLLSMKIVLTVGHWFNGGIPEESLVIRAGVYDPKVNDETVQERSVREVKMHPGFQYVSLYYDFALLVLDASFAPADNVSPICWDEEAVDLEYDETKCVSVGWGTGFGKRNLYELNELRRADLSVLDNKQCGKTLRTAGGLSRFFELHESFVCAKAMENTAKMCNIDGGAPLACALKKDTNQYVQIGVLSWDLGCDKNELPNVFSSFKLAKSWIKTEINNLEHL